MNLVLHPAGRIVRSVVFAAAFAFTGALAVAQTAEPSGAAPMSDAERRLQWLKARVPAKATTTAKSASAKSAAPKVGFRTSPQTVRTRSIETAGKEAASAAREKRTAESHPAEEPAAKAKTAEPAPAKSRSADEKVARTSTPAKTSPAPVAQPTPAAVAAEATPAKSSSTRSRVAKASPTPSAKATPAAVAKASPTPRAKVADAATTKSRAPEESSPKTTASGATKASPELVAKLTTPATVAEVAPTKARVTEARATPAPKATPLPAIASAQPAKRPAFKTATTESTAGSAKGRYPWRNSIVTTVFWIGEPVGGNNFTPNYASSWDAKWTSSYGGYDTPNPAARRNFAPVKFTPRQNPFYIALPYNDVTRGTTKPEARKVIPWFRHEFRREGQSVCRDRWVAIRNRAGKIAYAQWSDCGPFRTDHWQYVFGSERPRPNLNKGAGLDVSPAVRDYLGLDGTDLTDWKFVEFSEVPQGPWARWGDNNDFVTNATRPSKARTADSGARGRRREL